MRKSILVISCLLYGSCSGNVGNGGLVDGSGSPHDGEVVDGSGLPHDGEVVDQSKGDRSLVIRDVSGTYDGEPASHDVSADGLPCVPHPEICNGKDDDCDGKVPAGEKDSNGDGVLDCHGILTNYSCAHPGSALRGGGEGYGTWIDASKTGVKRVGTAAALVSALKAAKPGDVIYVNDGARIDMSTYYAKTVEIPGGVTLASGRGKAGSLGGMIYSTYKKYTPWASVFRVVGDRVRITGLRFRGPDVSVGVDNQDPIVVGILIRPKSGALPWNVEIDNCELYGWPAAAISVGDVKNGVRIHHNDIHHNQRHGLGYGVVEGTSHPQIGSNVFDFNRHSIASTGYPGSNYTACHNIVLPNGIDHAFDMHGGFDKGFYPNAAGTSMLVYDNIFLISSHAGIVIRGVPEKQATIHDNSFRHGAPPQKTRNGSSIVQTSWNRAPACLNTGGCNLIAWPGYPGYQKMSDKGVCRGACSPFENVTDPTKFIHIVSYANRFAQPHKYYWSISYGSSSSWTFRRFSGLEAKDLRAGDFDGDGTDDAIYTDAKSLYYFPSARFGRKTIVSSTAQLAALGLGDFNGDGKTDILHPTGSKWMVVYGGTSQWRQLNGSSYAFPDMALGDFNGDGNTDVFVSTGSEWRVSWGGKSGWVRLGLSSYPLSQLAFGDFNGDKKTDVFRTDGTNWWVSWGGTSKWDHLGGSGYRLDQLAFGDFNGDGKTDVFVAPAGKWLVSLGGTSSWKTFNGSSVPLSALLLGDFNGDGKTDVIARQ